MLTLSRAFALAACAVLAPPTASPAVPGGGSGCRRAAAAERDPIERGIFLAVLEGLYADGASTADVERVLSAPAEGGWYLHFVSSCPICEPARRAFESYRARLVHRDKRGNEIVLGPGVPAEIAAQLASPDLLARDAGVQALVERYLARWLDERRLTSDERAEWKHALEERRKKGMATLRAQQDSGAAPALAWKKACAICDGANGAFEPR